MNLPDTLDGEDVCVFIGVPKDTGYYAQMVTERFQSVIIALYDEALDISESDANDFLCCLDKLSSRLLDAKRCFFSMRIDEWDEFYCKHCLESFGLCHVYADKRMRSPQSARKTILPPRIVGELSSFSDIPDVQRQLQRVVDLLSGNPIAGMWPVSLLLGETGTGKSFAAAKIAEALKNRQVANGVFKQLNCAEFGKEDMNAALFGLHSGAFTVRTKEDIPGAIAEAKGGVLFLDEIGTLPMDLQPRLLKVLDNGEYRMHGSTVVRHANCRFIFGTNEDLAAAVKQGHFRFDLFNRISGVVVQLPSVRQRIDGEGGGSFLERMCDEFSEKFGGLRLTRQAKAMFIRFAKLQEWKGNFREITRCFWMLRAESERGVVSSLTMKRILDEADVWAAWLNCMKMNDGGGQQDVTPQLLKDAHLGTLDRLMLEFAFRCAAESTSCAKAGRRFFGGTCNHCYRKAMGNPTQYFKRFLNDFGFKFDEGVSGHIGRAEGSC